MDDTTTILEKSYHPSKNFSYRLPYKVLHMMWDIFNTLDEEHTGFIKKEYLSTALRAAGLIISNSQIEDIIYENKLEDAKEISMDLYFILVARYYRDQSMIDGELVDGTYINLPRLGKVRVLNVDASYGDPEDPSSMGFSCQVLVEKIDKHRKSENRRTQSVDIPWAQARYSHTIQEHIRHHSDQNMHQLITSFAYQEEEMTNRAVHNAFLGMYTDVSTTSEKKKIYEKDLFGKIRVDRSTGKPVIKRYQQFIAPDEIIRKKLCNPRNPEALSDAEYDKFISALPTGDDVYVRDGGPDSMSFAKDMEGVYEVVMDVYTRFMLEEDEDLVSLDEAGDALLANDEDDSRAHVKGESISGKLDALEKDVEETMGRGLRAGFDGVQKGLDGLGIHIPLTRNRSSSDSENDLSEFKDINNYDSADGNSDDESADSESSEASVRIPEGAAGSGVTTKYVDAIVEDMNDFSARKAASASLLRESRNDQGFKKFSITGDQFSTKAR